MSLMLEGKTAFVTGAGSGMGRATAIAMAREGAKLLCADLSGAEETVATIRANGGEVYGVSLDVTDQLAVDAAVDGMVARWGRIDIGFNNAGINIENKRDHWDRLDLFDRTMEVNVRGVMICMLAELRHMYPACSGSIINTASTASLSGIAGPGYVASKHAVLGLTRSAAHRYAEDGIRVNALCPGATFGGMMSERHDPQSLKVKAAAHPMNRIAQPEEMAEGVVFLASDRSSYMTGHPLAIDGGFGAV
jgi:NAD(P)-dependent dehydrogenase (short-subunit alcohol dehydrogenase family)